MFLVHRVPNGIAVKPLLKYWRTWSCLERITYISVRGARSEPQHGSNDTYDPTVKKVKLGLHLTPRNNYGISDQILTLESCKYSKVYIHTNTYKFKGSKYNIPQGESEKKSYTNLI